MKEISPLLLSARDSAAVAGVSLRTWWRLVSVGEAPKPVAVGGRLKRWRRNDLEEWVEELGAE